MEPSPIGLPQLSSYLPSSSSDTRSSSMATTGTVGVKKRRNSIEGSFSAVRPGSPTPLDLDSELLKRKQALDIEDKQSNAATLSRLNSIYQSQDHLVLSKGFSFSSTASSQDGDKPDGETTSYFASPQPAAAPRRERTSRYLSEGDRREIITRIDAGEKQVTLAREFSVSRAAICNLYKNRWEVLTRGNRNPDSKHPKKARVKRSSPRLTPQSVAIDEASAAVPESITVYPDVSSISINTEEESPRDDSVGSNMEGSTLYRPTREDGSSQESSTALQGDRHHQLGHHNHFRNEAEQQSPVQEPASSPVATRSFLVHEASAYSYPCRNLIAALRDESISTVLFQQRATRLVRLLIEEALTCLPHEDVRIKNQFGDVCHVTKSLDERDICAVSMEDKGMVLLRAFSTISPMSPTGAVSIEPARATDDNAIDNMASSVIRAQMPPIGAGQVVLLLDIQCATGNEACAVLHHLVHERQIPAKSIYFVTVISSFEGLQNIFRHFPDVTLIAAQVDTVVDAEQRIRPGIGDFMLRYWNGPTEPSAP